ncbi:hypothetical protein D0866_13083 [Hortaea werneckii]|uniref:Ribonucleases P/MRP subunit Pop8-like domain-containing protein n=1 Tax=Hortaea werneckii TaxID=91943 RepID=A0A3M6ZTZ9_HORWE|nr:hypothetical protein D0866_13083 [Hortaea werneckii]
MAQDESMQDVTESTAVTLPTTQASSPPDKKKRKRTSKNRILSQFAMRSPPWSYIHLQHLTPPGSEAKLDAVTAHLHLTASLSQFLGVHGTAISVDITKLEGKDVWIRVPNQDSSAVIAAAGGWTSGKGEGWRVKGSSSWDARAMARDSGQDLFQF